MGRSFTQPHGRSLSNHGAVPQPPASYQISEWSWPSICLVASFFVSARFPPGTTRRNSPMPGNGSCCCLRCSLLVSQVDPATNSNQRKLMASIDILRINSTSLVTHLPMVFVGHLAWDDQMPVGDERECSL